MLLLELRPSNLLNQFCWKSSFISWRYQHFWFYYLTKWKHTDARVRRYEKEVISLALTLWTRTPKLWRIPKIRSIIAMPQKFYHYIKNVSNKKPGINPNMMRWMANEARPQNLNAIGYVGGLILDEMNVKKALTSLNKCGEWRMVGIPDLGEGSSAMAALVKNKNTLELADHMLQFLFRGLTGFRKTFASFPTNQANSCDLHLNVWDSTSSLQDWGFTVAYLCLDPTIAHLLRCTSIQIFYNLICS